MAVSTKPGRSIRLSTYWALGVLAVALAYSVSQQGGRVPLPWNISLLLVGVVAVLYWLITPADHLAPPIGRWLGWAVLLAPAFVAFQAIPLPVFLLRILSPNRARMIDGLSGVMNPPRFASLSIDPATTFFWFLKIVVFAVVFLLVRDLSWRAWRRRSWAPVIPLIGIAGLEAWFGLAQITDANGVHGTYRNRNHFAGLLEMVLPISVAFAVALLQPDPSARTDPHPRNTLAFSAALKSGAIFAIAALMITALVYSASKSGFVACLAAFFLMGALALATRVKGTKKWLGVAALAMLFVGIFVFFPTDQLANALTGAVSNDPASLEGRQPIWSDSLHLLRAYPVLGSGLGTYGTAFLKYQTALIDLDFSFAHNDYLQLATELGIVGCLILLGLMAAVLVRAVRTAIEGPDRSVRILGLGCAAAIAAIAIHSLTDFNMSIPANALLLAWIAGIAAGVPDRYKAEDWEQSSTVRPRLWKFAVGLACLLVIYAPAAILLETGFQGNARAESLFCRFGVCDTDSIVAAHTQEAFLKAVRREPAAPHRWCDLGESMLKSGDVKQARYCFSKALEMGPNIPPILIRAAKFYRSIHEDESALEQTALVLEKSSFDDSEVFDWYTAEEIPVTEILCNGLPAGPRAVQAYLRYVMGLGRVADAEKVWEWALSHNDTDETMARTYVNFLVNDHRFEEAAQTWALHLGDRRNGYLKSNWLLNGDFESEPSGVALDWRIQNLNDSVIATLDPAVAHTGARSLRIDFAGKENVNYSQTTQTAVVTPGWYRFEVFVRTKDITTDQGVGFHIYDPERPSRLDLQTERLTGSNDWRKIERTIQVFQGTRLLSVGVTRQPTWKFDSKISGTAWIDSVSLRKVK